MSRQPRSWPHLTASFVTTWTVLHALDRLTGKGLRRQNYRGRQVSMSAGPAVAAGIVVGAMRSPSPLAPVACAVGGAALAGAYDDWASAKEHERQVKGFRGHLLALRRGQASAGSVKVVVVGGAALGAGWLRRRTVAEALLDGALVAGTANLANLLDLRPGRTTKVLLLLTAVRAATVGPASRAKVAATMGALVAALPADLSERSMLGDAGANAAGAMVGLLVCESRRTTRCLLLGVVLALTALSEKVSFSAVIARNPLLRRIDELGRSGG